MIIMHIYLYICICAKEPHNSSYNTFYTFVVDVSTFCDECTLLVRKMNHIYIYIYIYIYIFVHKKMLLYTTTTTNNINNHV